MSEELTLAKDVEDPTSIDQLDQPPADDPDVLQGPLPLPKDRPAAGKELHFDGTREFLERVLRKRVERSVAREKFDYVVHRRGPLPDCSPQFCDGSSGMRAIKAYCPPLRASTSLQSVAGSSGKSSLGRGGSTIQESSSISASS
jgi:hypothetical protein